MILKYFSNIDQHFTKENTIDIIIDVPQKIKKKQQTFQVVLQPD